MTLTVTGCARDAARRRQEPQRAHGRRLRRSGLCLLSTATSSDCARSSRLSSWSSKNGLWRGIPLPRSLSVGSRRGMSSEAHSEPSRLPSRAGESRAGACVRAGSGDRLAFLPRLHAGLTLGGLIALVIGFLWLNQFRSSSSAGTNREPANSGWDPSPRPLRHRPRWKRISITLRTSLQSAPWVPRSHPATRISSNSL